MTFEIHIPADLRYQCSGCGNCCLTWPVPVTASDRSRISRLDWTGHQLAPWGDSLFAPLKETDSQLKCFTHTLEKRLDGKCEFLTEENRCLLHQTFGPESKPSMCQLFPYTFTKTPSGVYASVSFASTGALLNSGPLLSEQRDLLERKWELFSRLFPEIDLDWSQLQLIDGQSISWQEYLTREAEMLRIVQSQEPTRVDQRLSLVSGILIKSLKSPEDMEKSPPMEARPKVIDQVLLKHLHQLYFPANEFVGVPRDIDARQILTSLVHPPRELSVSIGSRQFSFREVNQTPAAVLDQESETLLSRYIYCRIFAKLYFGPGFHHFSLLAGIHHLILVIALIRLQAKLIGLTNNHNKIGFAEISELVRSTERRLTDIRFSKQSTAVLEVLLRSARRIERITSLTS